MLRILQFDTHGVASLSTDVNQIKPPEPGHFCWIDLENPDGDTLHFLGERFRFHPLTIEDCAHFDQIPKLEDYGDYLFLVTHAFNLLSEGIHDLGIIELHSFLSTHFLVTVHDQPLPALDMVFTRIENDPRSVLRGPDFMRYLVANALINELYPIFDRLLDDTEKVEMLIFSKAPPKDVLHEILRIKRLNVHLRRVLIPQRSVIALLTKSDQKFISKKTAIYFRDVHDNLVRQTEALESNREIIESVLTGYQWAISQRTNEIVKRLTLLSAVFLPLTFITGFFGQNFHGLPFESNYLLMGMLAACFIVPTTMLWYFLRSKWL